MLAASPPEGCSTNNNGALGFKVLGTYSMKVRSRPPTVLTWRVASPIGSAATVVATSANAAPIVKCGSVVSAMISRLRFTRAYRTTAKRYVCYLNARPPCISDVVQSGSMAKAAAQFRLKQTSVSDRSPQGIRPTIYGDAFKSMDRCKNAIAQPLRLGLWHDRCASDQIAAGLLQQISLQNQARGRSPPFIQC